MNITPTSQIVERRHIPASRMAAPDMVRLISNLSTEMKPLPPRRSQDTVDNNDNEEPPTPTLFQYFCQQMRHFESLNKEEARLNTFANYPSTVVDKRLLAQIGFYFIGPDDMVKCFFCKVEIGLWERDDNPVEEHFKWSPNCSLMRGRETSNEPIDAEELRRIIPQISYDTCGIHEVHPNAHVESEESSSSSQRSESIQAPEQVPAQVPHHRPETIEVYRAAHPTYRIEATRLASYEDWPSSMKQKPKELAEAGFYYTGKGDRVVCFSCGGGLKHWQENDIPWEEHAAIYSKCQYLKLMKGMDYIEKILARGTEQEPPMPQVEEPTMPKLEVLSLDDHKSPEENNRVCRICYLDDYCTVFIPCGHVLACLKCSSAVTTCPYCRTPISQITKIYFS